ncbi:MAG: hypothetical protein ACOC33_03250 [bacterium]
MYLQKNPLKLVSDFIYKHNNNIKDVELKEAIDHFYNIVRRSQVKEIVLCDICKGFGKVQKSKLVNYHHDDYEYWYEVCTFCDGKGRVVQQKIDETYIMKMTNEDKCDGE